MIATRFFDGGLLEVRHDGCALRRWFGGRMSSQRTRCREAWNMKGTKLKRVPKSRLPDGGQELGTSALPRCYQSLPKSVLSLATTQGPELPSISQPRKHPLQERPRDDCGTARGPSLRRVGSPQRPRLSSCRTKESRRGSRYCR